LLQAGLGTAGASLVATAWPRSGAVDPRDVGAIGGGLVDDRAAVLTAMRLASERRVPLDGGDVIFGIAGDLRLSGLRNPWIRSLRLKQLRPVNDRKTLHLVNCEAIRIDRLEIDVGRAKSIGYMNESAGLWIHGGSNHRISDVDVSGHGKNSLVAIWNTSDSHYVNFHVHDAEFDDRNCRDDVMQGIWLNANSNCILQSPRVSSLSGNARFRGRAFANLRTRGIALGGNQNCSVVDAVVQNVDQGIDVTGSEGNVGCSVIRGRAFQCTSVGLKFANSAQQCRATGFTAHRCGAQGFLVSGPNEAVSHPTADIEFRDCIALDTGYNHFPTTTAGFMIQAGAGAKGPLLNYPRGIRLLRCKAIDSQPAKSMDFGFYNNVIRPSAAFAANVLSDCDSAGHRIAARSGGWLIG
jgi:hypothetical protein